MNANKAVLLPPNAKAGKLKSSLSEGARKEETTIVTSFGGGTADGRHEGRPVGPSGHMVHTLHGGVLEIDHSV